MKKLLSLTLALFLALGNLSPIAMAEAVDTTIVPDENITEGENNTNPVPEAGETGTTTNPDGETNPTPVPMLLSDGNTDDNNKPAAKEIIYSATELGDDADNGYLAIEFNTHIDPVYKKDGVTYKYPVDFDDHEFFYIYVPIDYAGEDFCIDKIAANEEFKEAFNAALAQAKEDGKIDPDYEADIKSWKFAEDTDVENGKTNEEELLEKAIPNACYTYAGFVTLMKSLTGLHEEVFEDGDDDTDPDVDVTLNLTYNPQGKLTVMKSVEGPDPFDTSHTYDIKLTITSNKPLDQIKGNNAEITLDNTNSYTFTLHDGEAEEFTGIPSDAKYTVTELSTGYFTTGYVVGETSVEKVENVALTTSGFVKVTNTYKAPQAVTGINLKLKKNLIGDNSVVEKFTIAVTSVTATDRWERNPKDFSPMSPAVESGNVSIVPLGKFTEAGVYTYKIKEEVPDGAVNGFLNGIQYDTKEHKIVITVDYKVENGVYNGELYVKSVTDENGNPINMNGNDIPFTITNTKYAPVTLDGETNLVVTKNLEGREWINDDKYEFTIEASENNPAIVAVPEKITIDSASADHKNHFADIIFNVAGEYTFTVKEVKGNLGGIAYDKTAKTITVVVTDNGEGKLTAKRTDKTELIFNNKYSPSDLVIIPTRKPDEEGMIGIALEKIIENSEWRDGYKFDFKIEPLDGAPAPTETVCTVTGPNQQFDFGILTIKADDMGGAKEKSFRYKVTEVIPEEPIPGITYTTEPVTFVVKVRDNGEGFLIAEGHILNESDNTNTGKFVNKYSAKPVTLTGETAITATKKLTGRDWTADDSFEFTLKSTEVPEGVEFSYESKKNATRGNEKVVFNDITFNTTGTYKFLLSETVVKNIGIEYPETVEIVVEVTDEGKGQLVAKIAEDKYNYELENMYSAEPAKLTGETGLHVKKILVGRPWEDNDKFEFKLEPIKDYGNDISINADKSTAFATKEKHEALEIGDITFNKAGTYEFKLYEVAGSEKYMHYDTAVRNITVSVNDNNKGNLEVTAVNGNKEFAAFEFENIFVEENLIYITKQVAKTTTDMAFDFDIVFTDLEGKNLSDDEVNFNWTKGEEKGKFTKAADTFKLADDETIVIELPENVRIKVTEKPYNHYEVTIKENGDELQGKEEILAGGEDAKYEVTNTYKNRRPDPKPRPDDDDDDDDDKKPTPRPYPIIRPIEIPSTGANI